MINTQRSSGLDVDGNGVLDISGVDRITASEQQYVTGMGGLYRVRRQRVHGLAGSSASVVVSEQFERVSGFGGGIVGEQQSVDVHGNLTRSTVVVNRGAQTEQRVTSVPGSAVDAVSTSVAGLLVASTSATGVSVGYDYDGLGRRTGVTCYRPH